MASCEYKELEVIDSINVNDECCVMYLDNGVDIDNAAGSASPPPPPPTAKKKDYNHPFVSLPKPATIVRMSNQAIVKKFFSMDVDYLSPKVSSSWKESSNSVGLKNGANNCDLMLTNDNSSSANGQYLPNPLHENATANAEQQCLPLKTSASFFTTTTTSLGRTQSNLGTSDFHFNNAPAQADKLVKGNFAFASYGAAATSFVNNHLGTTDHSSANTRLSKDSVSSCRPTGLSSATGEIEHFVTVCEENVFDGTFTSFGTARHGSVRNLLRVASDSLSPCSRTQKNSTTNRNVKEHAPFVCQTSLTGRDAPHTGATVSDDVPPAMTLREQPFLTFNTKKSTTTSNDDNELIVMTTPESRSVPLKKRKSSLRETFVNFVNGKDKEHECENGDESTNSNTSMHRCVADVSSRSPRRSGDDEVAIKGKTPSATTGPKVENKSRAEHSSSIDAHTVNTSHVQLTTRPRRGSILFID